MRVPDAAKQLDVSVSTVYGLVASGRLRCHRVGLGRGSIRITPEHLAEYLAGTERRTEAPTPPKPFIARVNLKHLKR